MIKNQSIGISNFNDTNDQYRQIEKTYPISKHRSAAARTVMIAEYIRLLRTLPTVDEDVLFISFGCSGNGGQEQQLPTYLQTIAKTTKARAILIDAYENGFSADEKISQEASDLQLIPFQSAEHNNRRYKQADSFLTVDFFACFLFDEELFCTALHKVIASVLDRGGRVFIANHTQAWSFQDIPFVERVCNQLKTSHSNAALGLQVYIQGGSGKVRYYLKNVSDYKTQSCSNYPNWSDTYFYPATNEFYICDSIKKLSGIAEFQANFNPLEKHCSPKKEQFPTHTDNDFMSLVVHESITVDAIEKNNPNTDKYEDIVLFDSVDNNSNEIMLDRNTNELMTTEETPATMMHNEQLFPLPILEVSPRLMDTSREFPPSSISPAFILNIVCMPQASTIISAIMFVAGLAFFSVALAGMFVSIGIGIVPAAGLAVVGVGLAAIGVSRLRNFFFKPKKEIAGNMPAENSTLLATGTF